jgi:Swt1-like HEPN
VEGDRGDWVKTPETMRRSIERAVDLGVPASAVAFYARWWQLETWLRELVYMELRAKYGTKWLDHLAKTAQSRAGKDEINWYMATPDASNVLAYLDVSDLLQLIGSDEHWPLFAPSLLPRARWDVTVEMLRDLRNRNAHCRRPHEDDLGRIEQTLRDLEKGARVALEAHNVRSYFTEGMTDPIAIGWMRKEHPAANRLVDHCARQYEAHLRLEWSVRPWARSPDEGQVAGREGVFVHATFQLNRGELNLERFWRDYFYDKSALNHRLVFLIMDGLSAPSFTFSAVDGAESVNDMIGAAFDAVIVSHNTPRTPPHFDADNLAREYDRLRKTAADLDARVHVYSALSLAHEDQPFRVFDAG